MIELQKRIRKIIKEIDSKHTMDSCGQCPFGGDSSNHLSSQ